MDVVEVVPDLFYLRFPVGHAYLWRDADGLTLIDTSTPGNGTEIADAIRAIGSQPTDLRRVVLTHYHVDHAGSAAEIAAWGGVQICAHRADAPFVRGEAVGPAPVLADWERPLYARVVGDGPAPTPPQARIDIEVEDADVLDFGGGARIVAGPGHTPGSVAIHLPERRVLFTGDIAAGRGDGEAMLGVFNADPPRAAASFRRLAGLDVDTVCFGHGEPLVRGAAGALRRAAEKQP